MKTIYLSLFIFTSLYQSSCLALNELYSVTLIGDDKGQNLMTIKETENKNDISKMETIFHEHVSPLASSLATGCMIDKIAEKRKFSDYIFIDSTYNKITYFDKYVRFTNNPSEVDPQLKPLRESDMSKQICKKMKLQLSTN